MRHVPLLWSRLLERGRLSAAAYRVLTGLALVYVASALWSVRGDDVVAGPVGAVLFVVGIVVGARGAAAWLSDRARTRRVG